MGWLQRVEDTNSPRFKEVSLPLNPFIDDSAPPTQGDFDCPVKIEIFRTKPEVETSDSKEGTTRTERPFWNPSHRSPVNSGNRFKYRAR